MFYLILFSFYSRRFFSRSRRYGVLKNGKRILREESLVLILPGARINSSKIAHMVVFPLKLSLYVIVLVPLGFCWSGHIVILTARYTQRLDLLQRQIRVNHLVLSALSHLLAILSVYALKESLSDPLLIFFYYFFLITLLQI